MYKIKRPIGVYDLQNNFKGFLSEFLGGSNLNEYHKINIKFYRKKHNPFEVEIQGNKYIVRHYE